MRLLGELFGVPAGSLARFTEVHLEELRPERLHLLLHHGPRVECLDHRAQPSRGRDGL